MKAKKDTLFLRVTGTTELPTQDSRIDGFTLNGMRTDAAGMPQTTYLDQVKFIGAAFFSAAMQTTKLSLQTGPEVVRHAITPEQADRLLEVFAERKDNKVGDGLLMSLLIEAGLAK